MKFKKGDVIVVGNYYKKKWLPAHINAMSCIDDLATQTSRHECGFYDDCNIRKCKHDETVNFYYLIDDVDECDDYFCEYELRLASDREKFLYYTHGPLVLIKGLKK